MPQPPAQKPNALNQYQAQRKFDKIARKYFDPTNGLVNYVENKTLGNLDDDQRDFEWAFLLSEMEKDLPTMQAYKRDFPTISDPNSMVGHMMQYLNEKYHMSNPLVKAIYDSDEMKQKIRVHLAFQAGKKKEFRKWMDAKKIKPSSQSKALEPRIKNDDQTKLEKLGKKYFGDSADKVGEQNMAQPENATKESQIQQAVLYNELKNFEYWISNTPELKDAEGYEQKLYEKLNSMSPSWDVTIQNRAAERMAYQAGRRRQYFKLKMAGRLEK